MNASILLDSLARNPSATLALDVVLKATAVLAAVAAASLGLRRSSAAVRHLAWCLGLAAALAIPVLSLALPGWAWRVLPVVGNEDHPTRTAATGSPAPRSHWAGHSADMLNELNDDEGALAATTTTTSAGPSTQPTGAAAATSTDPSWRFNPSWSWFWGAWLAGLLAVLTPPVAGRLALWSLARTAEPIANAAWTALLDDLAGGLGLSRSIRLLQSDCAVMPMTWGAIRPVILLPADARAWTLDRRRAVLLHELAHVRRFDCLTQAIARLACAVYWFHPLAWIAERRTRVERERACDDAVLRQGVRASEYAGHLLAIARQLHTPRVAGMAVTAMARQSQLEDRLHAILDPDRPRRGLGLTATAAAMVALLLIPPLAMLRVQAREEAGVTIPVQEPIADKAADNRPAVRVTVTGRVLDPSGKPVPDAAVMVVEESNSLDQGPGMKLFPMAASHGRCDGSGRFRVELPHARSARPDRLVVTALAPGYGIGWSELDPNADPAAADVTLRTEQVIQGRIFDVQGQPARGLKLWVRSVHTYVHNDVSNPIFRPDYAEPPWRELPGWPDAAISDNEGRFTLRGIGIGVELLLLTDDSRYSLRPTWISTVSGADTRMSRFPFPAIHVERGANPAPIKLAVQPARRIVGRVTYADTGKSVPHAVVLVNQQRFKADAEGRFRVPAISVLDTPVERFMIQAWSPEPGPYLGVGTQGEWPKGAVEQSVDLALPRGKMLHGTITEEGTGQPIAGVTVAAIPAVVPQGPGRGLPALASTGLDGSYRIAVAEEPCYLSVQASDEYVLRETSAITGEFPKARRRRHRLYAHAAWAIDVKPNGPDTFDFTLRRGVSVRGRVVDPDGQPVPDAWFYSRIVLRNTPRGGWQLWYVADDRDRGHVRGGRFVLHGIDAAGNAEVPVYFLDPERKLGATVKFSARSAAGGEITVRLERCGMAAARLVGPDGKPLEHYRAGGLVSMVATAGPPRSGRAMPGGPLFADEALVVMVDPVNYPVNFESDAQGHITFPALIPGASYRFVDGTPALGEGGGEPVVRREFVVGPGEAVELGDILIARPRRQGQ